ncbi:MAG: FAD-dependent oxidoreductase [Pyrinomonadaceae bacterium]|nr:FAD-dependent oxidoreductase [Pyrinomonadaceae bacterium]
MDCEVAVVGGGIGGLTVAALLAERGVDVCLLERESRVGGCAANFEKFDYSFEQGYGLYASWQPNEIHARVFSELPVEPPETRFLEPSYIVRLPDQSEVALISNTEKFEENLRSVFPECSAEAVEFYRRLVEVGAALRRTFQHTPDILTSSEAQQANTLLREDRISAEIIGAPQQTTADRLQAVSQRFRGFVDVQLQALAQAPSSVVGYLPAALALTAPLEGMFAIRGGAGALADRLAESITQSGGRVRLDAPVLRLAYDSAGQARGLDLLSGETLTASRAIISNLTVWDTYGKLIGLNRTPSVIRQQLKTLHSWGAYLLYLAMDEDAAERIGSDHILALTEWSGEGQYDPERQHLMFAAAPAWDSRAPLGKRAVTVHAFTEVDDWFTFHTDETELEAKDQTMLEQCWQRLHSAIPELGSSIEVIDTATPRTFYDLTRRRLGMVGSVAPALPGSQSLPGYVTSLPNVFLISDTTSPGGLASLTQAALVLANHLTNR